MSDFFLKIDGIPGESIDAVHHDEIEISSLSWGVTQAAVPGGATGRSVPQDVRFTAPISKASPPLFLRCATGQLIKEVILSGRKPGRGEVEYLKVRFSDVLVTQYESRVLDKTDTTLGSPMDSVSLNYSRVEYEYRPQGPDGSPLAAIKGNFDFKAGKAF